MEELWTTIVERLSKVLSETAIRTWFADCVLVGFDTNKITLRAGSDFKKTVIERQFTCTLKTVLKDLFGGEFEICVLNEEEARCLAEKERRKCENGHEPEDVSQYSFENFITGPANIFAFSAAKAVAENGGTQYNPLMIYGDSGMGKTHLLHAIGNAVRERRPETRIVRVKGDDFVNRLVQAIKNDTTAEFRDDFRTAELLLVDDVHVMAGKKATQEEFFFTFNAVYEAGHMIVMTSDSPPSELPTLEERLRTRFEWGLLANIGPLDPETRHSILSSKARELKLTLSEKETELFEAAKFTNVRQIEGALKSLSAYCEIMNRHPDMEQLEKLLKNVGATASAVTPASIVRETARYFNVPEDELRGSGRDSSTAKARHTAMLLLRRLLDMRLTEVGREFGGRNHSTVLSAIRKAEALAETDNEYRDAVESIALNAGGAL